MSTKALAYHPRFISLEGTEGVGKTTNLAFIQSYLEQAGVKLVLSREPGGTRLGESLRTLLLAEYPEGMSAEAELLMIFAARAQHVKEVILPALENGYWVLSDRFVDASYAYQGGGRGIPMQRIESLEAWLLGSFKTDHTVLLDAPLKIGKARMQGRQNDRIEQEKDAFFERVRQVYLDRAKDNPRYSVIDASQSLLDVQAMIQKVLDRLLTEAKQ